MTVSCIEAERVGDLADLPADHPLRRHAEECPRCRSLVLAYHSFMGAEPAVDSGLEDARARLDAWNRVRAETWSPDEARTSPRSHLPWWRVKLRPAAVAVAAVAVVAVVALWMTRTPETPVLREAGSVQTGAPSLQPAIVASDGSIHFAWSAVEGADAYEVRLYGPDLAEVAHAPRVSGTSVTVDRSELPRDLAPGVELTWRVYALSGGDVLQISAPGSVQLR